MRKRKIINRNRRHKKKKKIIFFSLITLLFLFSVGYAAFSSNISLTIQGNVKNCYAACQLKRNVTTTGDGLYTDNYTNKRYIFRGANPNNYICISNDSNCNDNEIYRIISIENDKTIKVIKNTSIGNMPWDSTSNQSNRTSTTSYDANTDEYCGLAYRNGTYMGCNSWGSKNTTFDSNGAQINSITVNNTPRTLPTSEASLNTYLNSEYINNLSFRDLINYHKFHIGRGDANLSTSYEINIERSFIWYGKIGLINAFDYFQASTNSSCIEPFDFYSNSNCYNNSDAYNYLFNGKEQWFITARSYNPQYYVWGADSNGSIYMGNNYAAKHSREVRPTFYLKKEIKLNGNGSRHSPYYLK